MIEKKNNKRNYKNLKLHKDIIMPAPASKSQMPESYGLFFTGFKERIRQERLKAILVIKLFFKIRVVEKW